MNPNNLHAMQVQPLPYTGRFVFALISAYLLSLFLPAIDIHVVAVGWGPVDLQFMGYDCVRALLHPWWWPNLLFLLGLVFLAIGRWSAARWCGIIATVIASTVTILLLPYLGELASAHHLDAHFRFPLRVGYFVWLGSMVGLTYSVRQFTSQAHQYCSSTKGLTSIWPFSVKRTHVERSADL